MERSALSHYIDGTFSVMDGLRIKLHRTQISEGGVATFSIIEPFKILKD